MPKKQGLDDLGKIAREALERLSKGGKKAKETTKLYASATKSGQKMLADREARRQFTRKNFPDRIERTNYRNAVRRDIREEGGIMGYSSPLGKPKKSGPSPVAKKAAKKVSAKKAPSKKAASKAKNDIPDPDFRGKVYNKKGGITKSYKDSVMRRSAGDY